MTALAQRLKDRYFRNEDHPYRHFEREVHGVLRPDHTLLDAGCGRRAPILAKFKGAAARLIGVDLVDFTLQDEAMTLVQGDLAHTGLPDQSVDVIMARSVMEHVSDPDAVYREMHRVLRPGGHFVFLTANLWDYSALIARIVPNRFHPWIVSRVEGRQEHDVFPVEYKTNTQSAVRRLAHTAGFEIRSFRYLGQYPGYLMFNGFLFMLGTLYEKLISRFDALRFLRGWILVVLTKPAKDA
jgi:SAM-dependent methyltransferase